MNSILYRNESKCDHCADYRVSSIDCTTNCSRCGGETGGSGSSTAHTTATDLTNPEGLEECYEKVVIIYSIVSWSNDFNIQLWMKNETQLCLSFLL